MAHIVGKNILAVWAAYILPSNNFSLLEGMKCSCLVNKNNQAIDVLLFQNKMAISLHKSLKLPHSEK